MKLYSSVRPYITIGILWSLVWVLLGIGLSVFLGGEHTLLAGLGYGIFGAGAGVIFASLLTDPEISTPGRFPSRRYGAFLGAITVLLMAGIVTRFSGLFFQATGWPTMFLLFIPHLGLGAVCSAGTLAVARRGRQLEGRDRSAPRITDE